MSELLIELYSEEIPAAMQINARAVFTDLMIEMFGDTGLLGPDKIKDREDFMTYTSPCRMVFHTDLLSGRVDVVSKERKGPRIGSPDKAMEGFLGANNIDKKELLERDGYYYIPGRAETLDTASVIAKEMPEVLRKLGNSWPKSMRWGDGEPDRRWIRPLKNILCLFDGKIVEFEFLGLTTNNKTRGHKFMSPKTQFSVASFGDYNKKMKENNVIFDHREREKIILSGLEKLAKEKDCLPYREDLNTANKNSIINECVGLTEYPEMLVGEIDKRFLALPEEVIINTLRSNQKYFCLRDERTETIQPLFVFACNIKTKDGGKSVAYGNARVCRARLDDALFYVNEDLSIPLEDRLDSLKRIIFHEKIGNLFDKTKRLGILSKFLALWIPRADLVLLSRAAMLCKIDLTTNMVSEMPELQGFIGGYYASVQKENPEVCAAIREHYYPLGQDSQLPSVVTAQALSIADKVDTLSSMFIANEIPTSSRDPFALRRAVLGIIKIVLAEEFDFDFNMLLNKSLNTFRASIYAKNDTTDNGAGYYKAKIQVQILEFVRERFRVFLKDDGFRPSLVDAVIRADMDMEKKKIRQPFNLLRTYKKLVNLDSALESENGQKVLAMYRRIYNIVNDIEDDEGIFEKLFRRRGSFGNEYENNLHKSMLAVKNELKSALKEQNYKDAMGAALAISDDLEAFFKNVMVNSDDEDERDRRVELLRGIKMALDRIVDFSLVE